MYAIVLAIAIAAAPGDATEWAGRAAAAEAAGDYAHAVSWYARIVKEAPASYPARRAAARLGELRAHADHGFAPFAAFETLKRDYARLGSDEAVARASRLLDDYPDASVAPAVLLWLGNEHRLTRRDPPGALAYYRRVSAEHPDHPLSAVALERAAAILQAQGDYAGARTAYEELGARFPERRTARSAAMGTAAAERAKLHGMLAAGAWAVLALSAALFVWVGGHRFDRRRFMRGAAALGGFALLLGFAPAAFLWVYDDQWSPSLSALGVAFAAYGTVLAALAARRRFPKGALAAFMEPVVFRFVAPLAILIILVHAFELWSAFYL